MAYLVIAYPGISQKDFEWIQNYRQQNDPRYFSVVDPHFTLVFAINDINKEQFLDEVEKQISDILPFDFTINVATINQDDSSKYYHEFLVPDVGYSNIVKLHDKLYSGLFAENLRFDIDFIPHIGIGNNEDVHTSKARVDDLNKQRVSISGIVNSVDVIEYEDGTIATIKKL